MKLYWTRRCAAAAFAYDEKGPELNAMVDLSPMLAQGGVFQRLRDPNIFQSVKIGSDGRTLIWKVGDGEDDVVDLCADALRLMARPVETNPTPNQQSVALSRPLQ